MSRVKTQLIVEGKNQTKRAFKEVNDSLESMDRQLRTAGRTLATYFSVQAMTGALRGIARISDSWVEMTDRLKIATDGQGEYGESLNRIREISDRTFTSMANNAELFINSLKPLQERGFTTNEILNFTEAVNLGLVASATKGQAAEQVIQQVSRAMQTGVLRGDAFNAVIEKSPALAEALARGLGVSRQELIRMAAAGELTSERVIPALNSQMDSLGEAVDGMSVTVGDALTRLQNAWDEALGTTDMSPLINALSDLQETISDPAVVQNLTMLASALVQLAGAVVGGGSEFADLGNRIGFMMAQASGAASELDKVEQQLRDVDRALNNRGLSRTIDSFIYSKEELEAERTRLEERKKMLIESLTGVSVEAQQIADQAAEDAKARQDQELADYRKYLADMRSVQEQVVKNAADAAKKLVAAERSATRDIEKVRSDRLKIEDRYAEALAGLNAGGDPSYRAAQALKVRARQALAAGNVPEAQRQAQAALKMMQDLASAGANTFGFAGFIKELEAIELAANDIENTRAEEKLKAVKAEMADLAKQAEELKATPISFEMDDAKLAEVRKQILDLAKQLKAELVLPVSVANPTASSASIPGFATGGAIRGAGTGTSDSILARLSNGEYVVKAAAVRKYGTHLLDSLNGMRLPKYADGGLVGNVSPAGGGGTPLNLVLDGSSYKFSGDADTIARLAKAVRIKRLKGL